MSGVPPSRNPILVTNLSVRRRHVVEGAYRVLSGGVVFRTAHPAQAVAGFLDDDAGDER
jgi:hypothetical protein